MQFIGRESQADALAGELAELFHQSLAVAGGGVAARFFGDESALAVAHLQQAVARESLIDAENRVLIDGQLPGQFPHRGEPLTRLKLASGQVRGDLLDNLPRNRNGRAFFNAKEHEIAKMPGEMTN